MNHLTDLLAFGAELGIAAAASLISFVLTIVAAMAAVGFTVICVLVVGALGEVLAKSLFARFQAARKVLRQ